MPSAPNRLITLVRQDGTLPAGTIPPLKPFSEPLSFSQWEDGIIHFNWLKADRTAAPIPVGGAFQIVVRLQPFDPDPPPISVQATITNAAGGLDCGYFEIGSGDTGIMPIDIYGYDVDYIDENGTRWIAKPASPFYIVDTYGTPDTPVTPGVRQPPLGMGPPGDIREVKLSYGACLAGDAIVFDTTRSSGSDPSYCAMKNLASPYDPNSGAQSYQGIAVANAASGAQLFVRLYGDLASDISGLTGANAGPITVDYVTGRLREVTPDSSDLRYGFCDQNGNTVLLAPTSQG